MLTIFGGLCDLHGVFTRKTGQCFRPSRGLKSSSAQELQCRGWVAGVHTRLEEHLGPQELTPWREETGGNRKHKS